jgi:hypothetical protein
MASLTKVKLNNIDTSVTFVYDPLVLLNYGSTLANTDIGFVFNRDGGVSSNVALYWNETTDRVTVAYTSATGFNGNIAVTKMANVAADWYFGNLAGGTTNTVWVSANVLPTANAFYNFGSPTQRWNVGYFAATTLDLGGSQISVDPVNGFKFTVGGTGTPTYLASNGALSSTTLSTATTATVGTNLTVGGNIAASGFINTSGNVLGQAGVFNSMRVNGNDTVTGFLNVTGNILGATGTLSTLNVNGLINTTGNLSAAVVNAGAINSTGFFNTSANISAAAAFLGIINSTGYINTTANLLAAVGQFGSINSTGFINTAGNVSAAVGQFGSLTSTGLITTSANVSAAVGSFGAINSTGLINTSGNVSASMFSGGQIYVSGPVNAGGNVLAQTGIFNFLDVNGNIVVGAITTPGAGHSIIGNVVQSGAGTVFFNTPGNVMAAVGQFGEVRSTGLINTSGNISTAQLNAGQINTTGNVLALNISGASINLTGNILAQTANVGQIGVVNSLVVGQSAYVGELFVTTRAADEGGQIQLATAVTNTTLSGNITIDVYQNRLRIWESGGTNRGGYFDISGLAAGVGTDLAAGGGGGYGNVQVATYLPTYTGTIGASLINSTGNVLATGGIFNALTVNGNESITGFLNVTGNIIARTADVGGIEATGVIYANSTIQSTAITDGALIVAGGVGISKDVHVGGNLTINGNLFINGNTVSINANNLTVNDSLLFLADENPADIIDIGFTAHVTNPILNHVGFVRDASDGVWKLFSNVVAQPTTTVDFTNAIYSPLYIGSLTAVGNILATGLSIFGNTRIGSLATPGALHTIIGNVDVSGAGTEYFNISGNILAVQASFGSINSTGLINTTGNVLASQFVGSGSLLTVLPGYAYSNVNTAAYTQTMGFTNYSNVNVIAYLAGGISSTGFINTTGNVSAAVHTGGAVSVTGLINTTGNVLAASVSAGSISSTGFINTSANISASQGSFGSLVSTGVINTSGNVLASTAVFNYLDVNGNIDVGSIATPGAGHTIVGNITQSGAGVVRFNTSGNILAAAGTFSSATVNGIVSASNVTVAGNVTATYFLGNGALLTGIVAGGGGGGFVYTVSVSPPVTSNAGDVWYDSGTDTLFQRINDGTNTYWVDVAGLPLNINTVVQGTSLSVTGPGTITGNLNTGNVLPVTSNVFTLGSSSNWYTRTWSQAVNALYADLAEKYSSDADYDPGTVLMFGGLAEVTRSVNSHDPAIAGVVSTNPAYLMNSNQEGVNVALTGRVPCWVKGPINKGDRVVSSDIPGVGEKLNLDKYQPGCIIGKSLESLNNDEIKKIEVVVGRI